MKVWVVRVKPKTELKFRYLIFLDIQKIIVTLSINFKEAKFQKTKKTKLKVPLLSLLLLISSLVGWGCGRSGRALAGPGNVSPEKYHDDCKNRLWADMISGEPWVKTRLWADMISGRRGLTQIPTGTPLTP